MIKHLHVKNQLSFKKIDVNFGGGLIAFTGPSGAGKSVFMRAILSVFGQSDGSASSIEAVVSDRLELEEFGLESDEINIFKYIKEKSARYFVNNQSVSKKSIAQISKSFLNSLAVRDSEEFENNRLITLLDAFIGKKIASHVKEVSEFEREFLQFRELKNRLEDIEAKERKLEELKEFALFEISKIDSVDPKVGEDEKLMSFKRSLSKKEKIQERLEKANTIFDSQSDVSEFLSLIEKDSSFFDESINELRVILEDERDRLSELEEQDIETLLERIEKISSLKSRYGSIEDILEYRKKKQKELEGYENISFEKQKLISACMTKLDALKSKSKVLSQRRAQHLETLNARINWYLKMLYMPKVNIEIAQIQLYEKGSDSLGVELGDVNIKRISSGEYNRLRLAFIATTSEYLLGAGGVLMLDEIDANLSGKESMSVAKVLKMLSKKYQIFAISHQPQLSSQADSHFLITKDESGSRVRLLDYDERVVELARMVSGEEVSSEATDFAKALMEKV